MDFLPPHLCHDSQKVIQLGAKTRPEFEEKVKSIYLYGPDLTEEEVDLLLVVYRTCSRAHPNYESKNKITKKPKKAKQADDEAAADQPDQPDQPAYYDMQPAYEAAADQPDQPAYYDMQPAYICECCRAAWW